MAEISDVLLAEEKLVRQLMAGWKRRGSSLLQIGLHSFIRPEFFWDAGFEVCATDENLQAIQNSFDISGPRIDYSLAKIDHAVQNNAKKSGFLPFDDNSFDFAFFSCYASPHYLNLKKENNGGEVNLMNYKNNKMLIADLPQFLQFNLLSELFEENCIFNEAYRVASKGLIVLIKNKFSLKKNLTTGKSINIFSFLNYLKKYNGETQIKFISASIMPKFIHRTLNIDNVLIPYSPLGDFLGLRISFDKALVTGLGLRANLEKNMSKEAVIQRKSSI